MERRKPRSEKAIAESRVFALNLKT